MVRMRVTEMRQEIAADAARATPIAAYFVTILNGVDWGSVAAMLAAIYTLILILEKVLRWFVVPKVAKALLAPTPSRDPANE